MVKFRPWLLSLIPLLLLVTWFWKPTLFDGQSIIHGDSIVLGHSLLALQANSFHHLGQLVWADGLYGGHPIFAEGQGAFASPFNMILAWVIVPLIGLVPATNLGHYLLMLVAGIGVIGLTRSLGTSWIAASFAAVAVILSEGWIGASQNTAIQGTLAWTPWTMWAFEEWLRRPSIRSANLLGSAIAMMVLSGYPQTLHGAGVYLAVSLFVVPFQAGTRNLWTTEWRTRLLTGLLAVLVCVGLSAVQWLPLLELAGRSHRSAGIEIFAHLPFSGYMRGLLFAWRSAPGDRYFAGVGSLFLIMLASLSFCMPTPARAKGHMLAAAALLLLGMEKASPLFRLLYDHDLLPGLRYFRTDSIYTEIGIVGVGVLAALALDGLINPIAGCISERRGQWNKVAMVGLLAAWAIVAALLWDAGIGWTNLISAAGATGGGIVLIVVKRTGMLQPFLFIVLAVEYVALKPGEFRFYDAQILAQPASVKAILADQQKRQDKSFDASLAGAYGFIDSHNPEVARQARRAMAATTASTNVIWGLKSMRGALALPTARLLAVDKQIQDEIEGNSNLPEGTRLIDLLDVRFIAADQPTDRAAFRLYWSDPSLGIYIMENTASRPLFQFFARAITVASPEQALQVLTAQRAPALVIEHAEGTAPDAASAIAPAAMEASAAVAVLKAKSTRYSLDVTAPQNGWLFVADANYPGWTAKVDGTPTPVFSANILGKAIELPAGRHRLDLTFTSPTLCYGMLITGGTLVGLVLAFALRMRNPANRSEA